MLYLMSPEGEFVDFFTQMMTASEVADKVEKIVTGKGGRR